MGILIGGALLFRLLYLGCRRVLSGDEVHYAESLFRFLNGRFLEGVSDYWSFLYPFAAIPFGLLSGDAEKGLRLLSIASGAALVIPAVMIAHRLWGRRAALFAGLFVALHPNLISFSTAAMTEIFYSFLLLCAVLLLLRPNGGGYGRHAGSGALLAVAYLTRPEAVVLLALFAAVVVTGGSGAGPAAPPSVRFRRSFALGIAFIVVLVPYFVLLHAATGRWTSGSKAAVNLSSPVIWQDDLAREEYVYRLNDECSARRIEDAGRDSAARVLWKQKGEIASRYAGKLVAGFRLLRPLYSSPLLLLIVPLGILGWRGTARERRGKVILLLLGIFPFLFYAVFRVEFRYLVSYLPIHLLWAGAGCAAIYDWIVRHVSGRRVLAGSIIGLVFLSLAPYSVHKYMTQARSEPLEWRRIGEWIRDREPSRPRILAKSGCSISYYAGNPLATYIPWTDVSGLVRFMKINRFDYLAADEAYIRAARPTLESLFEDPPSDFERVEEFRTLDEGRIVLFRLMPSS